MITYVTLPEATANIVQLLVGKASRNGNRPGFLDNMLEN
jgi:hypothetical protein